MLRTFRSNGLDAALEWHRGAALSDEELHFCAALLAANMRAQAKAAGRGSMVKAPALSAPARTLRLLRARLAALGSSALPGRGRPTGRPSQCLGCSSQPPPKPPISPHLTVQVGLERRGQEACAEGEPEPRAAGAVARPRARATTGDGRGEAGHLQSCGQCARPEAEPARICAAAVLHRGHAPCRDEARIGRPRGWLAESGRSLGQSEAYSGTQRSPQSTSWPKSEPPCSRPRHAADALPARAAAHPADAQQGPRSLPGARTRGARPCAPQHVQSAGRRPEPPRATRSHPEPAYASLGEHPELPPWAALERGPACK